MPHFCEKRGMENKICEACQAISKSSLGVNSDVIYTKNAIALKISLCSLHSIELFKIGQNSFLTKYSAITVNRQGKSQSLKEAVQDG